MAYKRITREHRVEKHFAQWEVFKLCMDSVKEYAGETLYNTQWIIGRIIEHEGIFYAIHSVIGHNVSAGYYMVLCHSLRDGMFFRD